MGMNGTPLLAAAGKVHRWQPAPDGAVYLLRIPSVDEQTEWECMIIARNAMLVWPATLVAEVERAVIALVPEDDPDRAKHLATIEDHRARMAEAANLLRAQHFDPTVSTEGIADLLRPSPAFSDLIAAVRPAWPEYGELEAARAKWPKVAGVAAARLFLIGWEGEGLPPFQKGLSGGASEESIRAIPPPVREAMAWEVYNLCNADWRTLGNWRAGSGTRPGPQPSNSDATLPASDPLPTPGP